MTLPIVRLQTTSRHNARYTTDPRQANATLYLFVRSVPTAREVESAMDRFSATLTTRHTQSVTYTNNERVVQALEHAVLDELMQREPLVRTTKEVYDTSTHPHWCDLLSPSQRNVKREQVELVELSAPSTPTHTTTTTTTNTKSQTVEMSPAQVYESGRQFADPYTAYEAYYARIRRDRNNEEDQDDITPHTPTRDQLESSRDKNDEATQLSAPSASTPLSSSSSQPHTQIPTRVEVEEEQHEAITSTPHAHTHTRHVDVSLQTTPGSRGPERPMHPLLDALLRRVQHDTMSKGREDSIGEEAELRASMTRMTDELDELARQVQSDLQDNIERGAIWTSAHRHLKSADEYVKELHTRLDAARRLYEAEQYEKETMQLAHIALLLEVKSMQLLLRDVCRVVAQAQDHAVSQGSDDRINTKVDEEDAKLIAELTELLSSFTAP